jgi:hypothetical protein
MRILVFEDDELRTGSMLFYRTSSKVVSKVD